MQKEQYIYLSKHSIIFTSGILIAPLESNYGWLECFPWSHRIRDNESRLYFTINRWYFILKFEHFHEYLIQQPASHVSILGTILNLFDVFVAVFFSVKFLESCGMTDNF
jgi:hypothetical protein